MSSVRGPSIVTNGLLLYLDAGNLKSYSGSGTSWNDLSGNTNHATLVNSPTYNSSNNGNLTFNGSNQYGTCSSLSNYNFGSAITVEFFHKNDGNVNYRGVVSNYYATGTGFDFRYGRENYFGGTNNGTRLYCIINTSANSYLTTINAEINVWGHYCFTYNGSLFQSYKNGVPFTNIAASGSLGSNTNPVTIARNSNSGEYLSGPLTIIKIYNYALSSQEISQNFNAMRGRYGL